MGNYKYFKVRFKLITPMLGTATDASIWQEHVLERAKKEITKANRLGDKINKSLDKYKGSEITEDKAVLELQGVMRTFLQLLGKPLDVPNTVEELLSFNTKFREEFEEEIKRRAELKATVFLRDKDGWPIISTHMILGNLKENLRIMVNNGDKSIIAYKVSVGETMALDVKPVDAFMRPSHDILRASSYEDLNLISNPGKGRYLLDHDRVILERPISFDRKGTRETVIAMSEVLPEGTEFGTILRVRQHSPIGIKALETLFDFGKNNGFGTWRGSGNMGSYKFQLKELEEYEEKTDDGWK